MLEAFAATLVLATVLFVATNIDDLLILVAFFADPRMSVRDVVNGQVLGLFVLVAVSLVAARASLLLPMPYVGLLGLLPIALGIAKLVRRDDDDDDAPAEPRKDTSWGRMLTIAAVTIANGGDNIGVYVPVFAVRSIAETIAIVVAFAVLTIVWCVMSYWLVNHRSIGAVIRKHAHRVLPYALIAIGLWVLYEADSASLLR